MDTVVISVVGALVLLMLGWLKLDIMRLIERVDRMDERLSARIDGLAERVAHLEGRLDEREHHRP